MSEIHQTPITVMQNAVVNYEEGGEVVRAEGTVEIYDQWVRLPDVLPTWIPREGVEQIHAK